MNPYLSWALLLFVAGGLGYYYNGGSHVLTKPATVEKTEQVSAAKKPKRQSKKAAAPVAPKQDLRVNTSPEAAATATATATADEPDYDNVQFARDLAKAKNGSALAVESDGSKKTQKAKTQRIKHGDSKGLQLSTSASSTTGADADDDMSPIDDTPVSVSAGDVSDMLEAAAPAASTLRITGSEKPKKEKKKAEPKAVETKKQRQTRLKREKQRVMNQEAEQERRQLLEKQLHTAREHERREAAKTKTSQPAPDAWKKPLSNTTNGAPASLLDTFDAPSSGQKSDQSGQSGQTADQVWTQDMPSEEEQMRMLSSIDESEWTTVPNKKEKKKRDANKSGDNMSEASSETPVPPKPKTVKKNAAAATLAFEPSTVPTVTAPAKGHPLDSDWTA